MVLCDSNSVLASILYIDVYNGRAAMARAKAGAKLSRAEEVRLSTTSDTLLQALKVAGWTAVCQCRDPARLPACVQVPVTAEVPAGQGENRAPPVIVVLCHWPLRSPPGGRPRILGIHLPLPAVRMPRSSHDSWAGRCWWPLVWIDSRLPHTHEQPPARLVGGRCLLVPGRPVR